MSGDPADIPIASEWAGSDDRNVPQGTARAFVESACVRWQSDIRLFLLGILQNRHLADEAWQRTAVLALQSADKVRLPTLRGWLFQIALNEARKIHREVRRNNQKINTAGFSGQINPTEPDIPANVPSPELLAINKEIQKVVQDCLLALPEEQQEVIRQRIYLGRTFSEISTALQLPLGTVLTWCRRGILRLKEDARLKNLMKD